jgi:hypothetical protein
MFYANICNINQFVKYLYEILKMTTVFDTLVSESDRVMGFKYRSPSINCVIRFDAPDSGDIKIKLLNLLDDMNIDQNEVRGGGGRYNSYTLDINLYDEKEAQAIINDLNIKLMIDGVKIMDPTYTIKHTEVAENIIRNTVRQMFYEMLLKNVI